MRDQTPASTAQRRTGWIIAAAGAVITISTLLPWAHIGELSVSGIDDEGRRPLVLGLAVLGLGIARGLGVRGRGWAIGVPAGTLVLGALVTLIGVGTWRGLGQANSDLDEIGLGFLADHLAISPGYGLALTVVAGVATVLVSSVALARQR